MGTDKRTYNEPVSPSAIFADAMKQYECAVDTLACRILGEPYNLHRIAADIFPAMFNGGLSGQVVLESVSQFRNNGHYTPGTVAAALKVSPEALYEMSRRDTDMDLSFAFGLFREIYGRFVEVQIADYTCGWAMQGMTGDEIRIQADRMRKDKAAFSRIAGSDGRAEFESELYAALDGKSFDYPVKPPLSALRKLAPYHEPGEYIIIAGRTGMGKSYIGLNYIYHLSALGVPTSYINLENTPKNVQKRIWQMHSGLQWSYNLGGLSDEKTRHAVRCWEEVKAMPFRSLATGRRLDSIVNAIRQEYYERGIKLAVVDYLQLMKEPSQKGNRVNELAEISAEIRALALELQIPIIGLAQINREAERTAGKRPSLVDLRGSGDLEQDASTVMLLFRPSVYEITEDSDGMPYPDNYADIHIAKGRDSGTALVKCRFDPIRGFYDAEQTPVFPTVPDYQNAQPFTMPRQETPDGVPF